MHRGCSGPHNYHQWRGQLDYLQTYSWCSTHCPEQVLVETEAVVQLLSLLLHMVCRCCCVHLLQFCVAWQTVRCPLYNIGVPQVRGSVLLGRMISRSYHLRTWRLKIPSGVFLGASLASDYCHPRAPGHIKLLERNRQRINQVGATVLMHSTSLAVLDSLTALKLAGEYFLSDSLTPHK
jgi:hypothetical protein